jgi:hypothetical protein
MAGDSARPVAYDLSMNDVLAVLLANLDYAFDQKAWHGPNLRGSLRRVTAAEAVRRPGRGRHNVWELTVHAAYWKYAARRRLTGEKRGSFPVKGSNWFPSPAKLPEDGWRDTVRMLEEEHRLLRQAVAAMGEAELRDRSKLRLVTGVAAHDVYHAGQIQLVKRLIRA